MGGDAVSAMQRTKGHSGEREAAALIRDLTGWDVRRRCRQHNGDSDLLGVPGWAIEVKRQKAAPRGLIASWWRQTVEQARVVAGGEEGRPGTVLIPLLVYRADRDQWRAVWPISILLLSRHDRQDMSQSGTLGEYKWTSESSVEVWASVAREIVNG